MECDPPSPTATPTSVKAYLAKAGLVLANLGLYNPYPMKPTMTDVETHPGWKECAELITEEVALEALLDTPVARYYEFLNTNNIEFIEIYRRPKPKNVRRVQEKIAAGKFFEANADMSCIRIVASLDSIKSIIRLFRDQPNIVERDRTVFNSDTNKLADIATFFYAFDTFANHFVTEIQVVHPFADLAFQRDSHLREFPGDGFDLFEGGFYERVKHDLLTRTYDVRKDMQEVFGAVLEDVIQALNK